MARDLQALGPLGDEIARRLGASAVHAVGVSATALAFRGMHLLLVRDHGHVVSLSLPSDRSWRVTTRAELEDAIFELRSPIANHTPIVTLADAIVAFQPILHHVSARHWEASFPGTPIPSEAWLKRDEQSVGLFQEGAAVRVVVWVDEEPREHVVEHAAEFARASRFLEGAVGEQARALAQPKAIEKPISIPTIEEVMRGLRAGKSYRTGGGRYYETFRIVDGRLMREIFDEGYTEEKPATEGDIAALLPKYPKEFGGR